MKQNPRQLKFIGSLFAVVFVLFSLSGEIHIAAGEENPPVDDLPNYIEFSPSTQNNKEQEGHPGVSSLLSELANTGKNGQPSFTESDISPLLEVVDDKVKVMMTMEDESSTDAMVRAIPQASGEVIARYKHWIDAWVPIDQIEHLANEPGVSYIQRAIPVEPPEPLLPLNEDLQENQEFAASANSGLQAGSYETQGVAASNADAWHAAGFTGQGVKVGVLDSFQDYEDAQAAGELPASINEHGILYTGSPHGTACAEIIYDMAPGVTFTFATPESAVQMAQYIAYLAANGHQVISSSMGYYSAESGDGSGPVSDAISEAYTDYGTLYVQAAGNQALYHWDGVFADDGNGFQKFGDGNINIIEYIGSPVQIPAGYPILAFLRWNDWPQSDQDYDLGLVAWDGLAWQMVAVSANEQNGSQKPNESIGVYAPATTYYGFVIRNYDADGGHVLDLMGHNMMGFSHKVSNRSLIDAATSPDSFSVAAVDVTSLDLESYSSWGPTHGSGGTLTGGHDQPRIAGMANVDTWAYRNRSSKFNGTSAATPHVAGAVALVWDAFPAYTNEQVKTFLEERATDKGSSGYDYQYGMGVLNLGTAPTIPAPLSIDGRIVFSSKRDGNYEIYVMDADGSNQTRLTDNSAIDVSPVWSPDGTRITFMSYRDGNSEIYVMDADGSNQTRLTDNATGDWVPAWSPDGTKIAFSSNRDGGDEIYVMDADGSNQTRLTDNAYDDYAPAWSPNGTKIAFESKRDGNSEIYVMDADGSNQTRLTDNSASDTSSTWSPDGTKIAFSSNRDGGDEIYVMDADGSNQTRLTDNSASDASPAWSPDGTKIAFSSDRDGNEEIYVMDANGSNQTRLTDNSTIDGYPDWWNDILPTPTPTPTLTPTPTPTLTPTPILTPTPTLTPAHDDENPTVYLPMIMR
jgi:ribosomal protein L13